MSILNLNIGNDEKLNAQAIYDRATTIRIIESGVQTIFAISQTKDLTEEEKETKKAIYCTFQFNERVFNVWLYSGPEDLRSDIGNALMQINFKDGLRPDFAVNWRYDVVTNEFWLSIRGEEWSPDLSVICKEYNGRGHPKASRCSLPASIPLRTIFVPKTN
jgi:hypothetical protein